MVRTTSEKTRARERGFTLIELIVVVAIIGILVTIAMPVYKDSVRRSKEAVLREDLYHMRQCIDQYFTDKGKYPADLGALVEEGYLRQVPVDPIAGGSEWDTEEADPDASTPDAPTGIKDVKSKAPGNGMDGTPFSSW